MPASFLDDNYNALAPLASPALTGTPTAPTASPNTNNTQIATTAYSDANAGFKVIDSQTIAAAANYVKTGLTGAGNIYQTIRLEFDLLPATNSVQLNITLYDSGGVEIVTNWFVGQFFYRASGSTGGAGTSAAAVAQLSITGIGISNDAAVGGISGWVEFTGLQSARQKKGVAQAAYWDVANAVSVGASSAISNQNTSVITGIKAAFSAGNITSGTVRLLGLI